ncbi:MAG: glycosyltransferase [Candidatus Omnitrophica bacterium]|nr:glycosyltransferase [Candidatus Omnitrophota bacterium]MDD5429410.1 glycosyltransferase [Candidatus Omnitrophota bacterium]
MKKLSIIIPAYNNADLTVKAVESVLNQTYKNIEIIVVDDGSTDNTREILQPYSKRIKYIYKKNGGACSARNLGISAANGEYIGFLDCDDIYLPRKAERSVKFLDEHPDYGFVYTAAYYIDENEKILRKFSHYLSRKTGWINKKLLLRNYICSSTAVIRKSSFEKTGVFDESIFTPADWDMWLRLSENYKVGYINEPLTLYRITDSYILKNIELFKNEETVVFNKVFKRNPRLRKSFKNRLISNINFRCAKIYILTGNFTKAKKELVESLTKFKLNPTTILLLIYLIIAPKSLQALMKKKVYYNFGLNKA